MDGWRVQRPASFSWVSRVIRASGLASRKRINAGVVITASPSQLTPRTRMRWGWARVGGEAFDIAAWSLIESHPLVAATVDLTSADRGVWPGAAFQRRCTQNQFAGSRRMAASK